MNEHAFLIWGKWAWMQKSLYFMLCAFLLSGCCKVQYAPFVSDKFPVKPINEITIYSTSLPDRPYFEIGMIEVDAPPKASLTTIIKSLKQKASEVGADAIIITNDRGEIAAVVPSGGFFIPIRRQIYQATAVRFR